MNRETVYIAYKTILLLLLTSFCFVLHAQKKEYTFYHYKVEDGLSQNTGNCILQDSKGFLWIGTWDGLNRFDGYNFKVYKNERGDSTSLGSNAVLSLYEDRYNNLWVGTDGGGLNKYNRKKDEFIRYTHDPHDSTSISGNKVKTMLEDHLGNLWIGTRDGGLDKFNRKTGEFINYSDSAKNFPHKDIWTLFEDSEGILWVGTFSSGLYKYDRVHDVFRAYKPQNNQNSIQGKVIRDIAEDKNGNIWIATFHKGLNKYNKETETFSHYSNNEDNPHSLSGNRVEDILVDNDGNIWIASYNGGLNYYVPNKDQFYHYQYDKSDPESITSNTLWTLYQDRSGLIWIGASGGIDKINPNRKKFNIHKHQSNQPHSLSQNNIKSLHTDRYGNIWCGLESGLDLYNEQTNKFYSLVKGGTNYMKKFGNNAIWEIHSNLSNNIWLAADTTGFYQLSFNPDFLKNPDQYSQPTDQISISDKHLLKNHFKGCHTTSLLEDNNGNLWMGSWGCGGIAKLTINDIKMQQSRTTAEFKLKQATSVIMSFLEDREGIIWVGTRNAGLYGLQNDEVIQHYQSKANDTNSLTHNTVMDILEDTVNNCLWLATSRGINQIKLGQATDKIKSYTQEDGLSSNIIYNIEQDNQGRLWLGTDYGLNRLNPETGNIATFSEEDGIPGNTFKRKTSAKSPSGKLYFGLNEGLISFYADSIRPNKTLPKIALTNLSIFNQDVSIGEQVKGQTVLKKSLQKTDKLVLSHKHNVFSLEFTALEFTYPQQNKYRYKLEGFDEEWNYTTAERRYAIYTNLDPGEYTLHLQGSNNDGIWNKKGRTLNIVITPPFYETWAFYILFTIFAGGIVLWIIRLRIQKTKKDKEILQQKIREAVSEVENQKEELQQTNEELEKRREEEKRQNWFNQGLAKFSDILSKNKESPHQLSNTILSELVKYLNCQQGCISLLRNDDNNPNNPSDKNAPYFEVVAFYAGDKQRIFNKTFMAEEGLIGSCYRDKQYVYINELPEDYPRITSGLGDEKPNVLLLMPMVIDENVLGVIELATFHDFEQLEIDFVKNIADNLASSLYVLQSTEQTNSMYVKSKKQAEQLASQEEELRQNLEEMQSTQDEMQRKEEHLNQKIADLEHKVSSLEEENRKLRNKTQE